MKYWTGHKFHLGFSIKCYRKTWMNLSANLIQGILYNFNIEGRISNQGS